MFRPEHEKLAAYERSLALVSDLVVISRSIPAPWDDLRDQLRRAATSITLNVAEGAGEFSNGEKARFYRMARRSASECMAVLDIARRVLDDPPDVDGPKVGLRRLSGMLTNMVKSVEARP